jgi:SagB-type dehydrogenase family enzyme
MRPPAWAAAICIALWCATGAPVQAAEMAAPPALATGEVLRLPVARTDGSMSLEKTLAQRRSVREFTATPLKLEEAAQLLWAAQGVTGPNGKRTAPSARARYPLELVLVANNVEGLEPGAYRYQPATHTLQPLARAEAGKQLLPPTSQPHMAQAAAVFVFAAVYSRMGTGDRARRWVDYEAGLATQNLLLEAVACGLGSVVTGTFDADAVKKATALRDEEELIILIPVGRPRAPGN